MTDKELRRLSRGELLEMLLAQTRENQRLREELERTQAELKNREILIAKSGTMAEASLRLNGMFEAADRAVSQYLENVRRIADEQLASLTVATAQNGKDPAKPPEETLEPESLFAGEHPAARPPLEPDLAAVLLGGDGAPDAENPEEEEFASDEELPDEDLYDSVIFFPQRKSGDATVQPKEESMPAVLFPKEGTGPENPAGKEGADRPGPRLRSGRMRPAGHRRTDVPGLDKRLAEEPTECYE